MRLLLSKHNKRTSSVLVYELLCIYFLQFTHLLHGQTAKTPVILWKNPDETKAFAEQTISLPDISGYEYFDLVFKLGTEASRRIVSRSYEMDMANTAEIVITNAGATPNVLNRIYTIKSDATIEFRGASAQRTNSTTPNTTANNSLIPIKLIGYKS